MHRNSHKSRLTYRGGANASVHFYSENKYGSPIFVKIPIRVCTK